MNLNTSAHMTENLSAPQTLETGTAASESPASVLGKPGAASAAASAEQYSYESHPGLTASFGWEGDKDAPIAYLDGSYCLRDRDRLMITFGVPDIPGKIEWYNKEGYLPCFVSKYSKDGLDHVVESFADLIVVDGKRYEIAYSRMITTNKTDAVMILPKVSPELIPLDGAAKLTVSPGETITRNYAIGADRFGNDYKYPSDSLIASLGSWEDHYTHMKDYWNDRLSALAEITKLPDKSLINAYKAGYLYTLIIADGDELHVGENGYDRVFDHDIIGMLATLLTIGDFQNVKGYAAHILDHVQYPDARWKYSWPFALYLMKTNDVGYLAEQFETIRANTHYIETQRIQNGHGIMMETNAIDYNGCWLIDNFSALMGLTAYQYICNRLGKEEEKNWASNQYDSLFSATEMHLKETMKNWDFNYLPVSMDVPNEQSQISDPRDANWGAALLFGRWTWDGYLFGARQDGLLLDLIDATYTHGFQRRSKLSNTIYNMGGYSSGYFSSAYNAGYGSAALRGERYRDFGIKAYQFMIRESMSGPFSWWEGIKDPSDTSPWKINHAVGGGGSCQHMWGQSTATKVLFDSLIAEKADHTVVIGRGIPSEWITDGEEIEIKNYPINGGKRMGYHLKTDGNTVTVTLTGDTSGTPMSVELIALKNKIVSAGGLPFDQERGIVSVPSGTKTVTVTLGTAVEETAQRTAMPQ